MRSRVLSRWHQILALWVGSLGRLLIQSAGILRPGKPTTSILTQKLAMLHIVAENKNFILRRPADPKRQGA